MGREGRGEAAKYAQRSKNPGSRILLDACMILQIARVGTRLEL